MSGNVYDNLETVIGGPREIIKTSVDEGRTVRKRELSLWTARNDRPTGSDDRGRNGHVILSSFTEIPIGN